jgi:hypothetical protein
MIRGWEKRGEPRLFGSWHVLHTGPGMCLCVIVRFGDLRGPRTRLNAGLVRPFVWDAPASTSSDVPRSWAPSRRWGVAWTPRKYEPVAWLGLPRCTRGPPMPAKHSIKRKRAEQAAGHRTVEVIDAHTFTAHLLTDAALAAGQLAKGRYIALCGRDVLPVSLVEPGSGRCSSCVSIPVQRSRVS